MHRVTKKVVRFYFYDNFGISGPNFITISLLNSERICGKVGIKIATSHGALCGRVPDLQSEGSRFESRPGLLAPRSTQPSVPPGSVNENQL